MLLAIGTILGACGGDDGEPDLTVFAAASLTEAFEGLQTTLEGTGSGPSLTFSFAGSQDLVQQIQQGGAPADVFASADEESMQRLVDADLVESPQVFARNELAIAVEPGNPEDVKGLADLARADLTVVLADPSVPVGRYSQQLLDAAGVSVEPASLELDVKATLAKVTSGEADAAIVYRTDVTAAAAQADAVEIPEDQNVIAAYPIAVVKTSGNREAAAAFVAEVVDGEGQQALRAHGFLPPD